jgi:hypothetical protein
MLSQIESEKDMVDGFLNSACELFAAEIPFYALRGNQENRGSFSYEFFNYFPTLGNQAYFAFRHGPAYFIFLDSGEDKPDSDVRYYGLSAFDAFRSEEAEWLSKVVQSTPFKEAPVRIVFVHMPPDENGWHGSQEVNRLFMPILNRAGIDLMLCGHLHEQLYILKGDKTNSFPILVNSNVCRTDVLISSSGVEMNVLDGSGKVVATYAIDKR